MECDVFNASNENKITLIEYAQSFHNTNTPSLLGLGWFTNVGVFFFQEGENKFFINLYGVSSSAFIGT